MALLREQATRTPERRRRRRALRVLARVLIVAGLLLVADAVLTLVWKEPVTHLYSRIQQDRLGDQLRDLEAAPAPPAERRQLERIVDEGPRLAFAARAFARRLETGAPMGRLVIPRIGLDEVVVHGTDGASLRNGPGHYPGTPVPGGQGTVGIAGHRTTYGAPFRHIDELEPGDRIEVRMPYGTFRYAVESKRIVEPTATWVTRPVGRQRLVLSACHPLYSAAQRIIVFARFAGAEPRGAARAA